MKKIHKFFSKDLLIFLVLLGFLFFSDFYRL